MVCSMYSPRPWSFQWMLHFIPPRKSYTVDSSKLLKYVHIASNEKIVISSLKSFRALTWSKFSSFLNNISFSVANVNDDDHLYLWVIETQRGIRKSLVNPSLTVSLSYFSNIRLIFLLIHTTWRDINDSHSTIFHPDKCLYTSSIGTSINVSIVIERKWCICPLWVQRRPCISCRINLPGSLSRLQEL